MANTEIVAPKLYEYTSINIELSLHKPSNAYKNELNHIFPALNEKLEEILVIPTMQKTCIELVNWGDVADKGIHSLTIHTFITYSFVYAPEKDNCLESFFVVAKLLCTELIALGHWADYIDPCSGLPMITPDCNKVFDEVQSAQVLLKYSIMNANCCKILLHPKYGSAVYPATIFTTAPTDVVTAMLSKHLKEAASE